MTEYTFLRSDVANSLYAKIVHNSFAGFWLSKNEYLQRLYVVGKCCHLAKLHRVCNNI